MLIHRRNETKIAAITDANIKKQLSREINNAKIVFATDSTVSVDHSHCYTL